MRGSRDLIEDEDRYGLGVMVRVEFMRTKRGHQGWGRGQQLITEGLFAFCTF